MECNFPIEAAFGGLSARLQTAADVVLVNPADIATRSQRSIAKVSDIAPTKSTRLALALGYAGCENLCETPKSKVGDRHTDDGSLEHPCAANAPRHSLEAALNTHWDTAAQTIAALRREIDPARLEKVPASIEDALEIYVSGADSATFLARYAAYLAAHTSAPWRLIDLNAPESLSPFAQATKGALLIGPTQEPGAIESSPGLMILSETITALSAQRMGKRVEVHMDKLNHLHCALGCFRSETCEPRPI
ncbi:MAG: hypothetical protein AAGF94_05165 [Pseudomonadota bacterium]